MEFPHNYGHGPSAEAKAPNRGPHANLSVLIIDDDQFIRSFIGRLLRNLGVREYQEAVNGIDGLRAIESAIVPFDLIICDIEMPDADGMVFMRCMAERKFATPLLVLSSKPADLLRSIQTMAEEYGLNVLQATQKPPSMALLDEALRRCRLVAEPKQSLYKAIYLPEEIL